MCTFWLLPQMSLTPLVFTVFYTSFRWDRKSTGRAVRCSVQNELALAQGRFHSWPPLTERRGAVSSASWHTALFIHPARSAVGPQPDLWIEYWPKVIRSAQNTPAPPPPPPQRPPLCFHQSGSAPGGPPWTPSWNTSAPVPLHWRGGGSSQIEIKARIQSIECPDLSQPSSTTASRLSLCLLNFRLSPGGALWGRTHGKRCKNTRQSGVLKEIRTEVFSYISTKRYLSTVCEVSSQTHEISIKYITFCT